MIALCVDKLHKTFQHKQQTIVAVQLASFTVAAGQIFGLIGPDGAGKTTLLRMLVSLLKPEVGQATILGHDVVRQSAYVRAHIGYMPQRFSLYPDLTVAENLAFYGDLFAVPLAVQQQRQARLYQFSQLERFKDRKAGALSGGMKQKLALICVLMHEPPLLILDEPTVGVDPVSRQEFWEIVQALAQEGVAIVVSTAYLDEAAQCDVVGLMHQGNLLAVAPPEELQQQYACSDLAGVFKKIQVPHG